MDRKYSIFETNWGYFGLISAEKAVLRTSLPVTSRSQARDTLLADLNETDLTEGTFDTVEKLVKDYYKGIYTDFSQIPVVFDSISGFAKDILTACRKITYSQTTTYGALADLAGYKKAGRAVGNALAKNRTPLIIPCHRIIRSNAQIGGFSAAGGANLKQKMLDLETERATKSH